MSYTITASTSVVLVPTSTGPFVVLFSSINATGRLITVRDNDGAASGANPITLSTLQGVTFSGVASNTIQINQPYGFVTFACQPNSTYSILNTFAFPAGSAAANISNLFASTIGINTNNVAGYVLNVNGTALIKDLNLSTTRVALGDGAGVYKNSNNTTAIGPFAGFSNQGDQGVAIGYYAGYSNQKASATALGPTSGLTNQGTEAVAVGFNAGRIDQGSNSIAIGSRAGLSAQPANSIVLNASGSALNGASANSLFVRPIRDDLAGSGTPLYYNPSTYEITRGPAAGSLSNFGDIYARSTFTNYISSSQSYSSNATIMNLNLSTTQIALGSGAGTFKANTNTISIGTNAGYSNQGIRAIAIGDVAGNINQENQSVAIGTNAGYSNQKSSAIAIGSTAGFIQQDASAIAIGNSAGVDYQQQGAIAIGYYAGYENQGSNSIGIGANAGDTNQRINAIAIGQAAGQSNQGSNSIAIGAYAGCNAQPENSIVLNASGSALNGASANSLFIRPIRDDLAGNGTPLYYNASTYEITRGPAPGSLSNFTNISASSTFTNYLSSGIIYTSNLGVGNATPATNLVVDVATNNSLTGIAARYGDVYTILGEESLANHGSLQVTREGTSSMISTSVWNLSIQPRGGNTYIGSNNNAYTTTINGSFLVPGGNVGIRTGSASFPLDVNGQVRIASNGAYTNSLLSIEDTSQFIRFYPNINTGGSFNNIVGANDSGIIFRGAGGVGTGNIAICPQASGTTGIKIMSNGNVGVGVASPSRSLDVNGQVIISSNGAYTNSLLNLTDNNQINFYPNLGNLSFNDIVSSNDSGIIFRGAGGVGTGNLAICPNAAGVKGIKITSNGNVGIGIASPSRSLDVNGQVKITCNASALDPSLSLNDGNNNINFYSKLPSNGAYNNLVSANDSAIIAQGSPSGVVGNLVISTKDNSSGIKIMSTGNIGIGTSAPSFPLDVNGNIRADDYIWSLGSGATTPGILNYIPLAYLTNGTAQTEWPMYPIVWTNNLPRNIASSNFMNADDGILVGPKVEVTLYDGPTGSSNSYVYSNANSSDFVYYATSPANTIKSYKSRFI